LLALPTVPTPIYIQAKERRVMRGGGGGWRCKGGMSLKMKGVVGKDMLLVEFDGKGGWARKGTMAAL